MKKNINVGKLELFYMSVGWVSESNAQIMLTFYM